MEPGCLWHRFPSATYGENDGATYNQKLYVQEHTKMSGEECHEAFVLLQWQIPALHCKTIKIGAFPNMRKQQHYPHGNAKEFGYDPISTVVIFYLQVLQVMVD